MTRNQPKTHKSLKNVFIFFCDNTSIHGFNRVTGGDITVFERTFWAVLSLTTLIVCCLQIQYLWGSYLESPVLITSDTFDIPVRQINFPGIAICNANKISKSRATQFAEELLKNSSRSNKHFRSKEDILEAIKLIANLYDFNLNSDDELLSFQLFLEKYDNLSFPSDLTYRITELAPTCDEMLAKCVWQGTETNCAEYMRVRMTFDGPCCVFNYIRIAKRMKLFRKLNKNQTSVKMEHALGAGIENGLQFALHNTIDDYFVTTTEIKGYLVYVFNSYDFADKSSGDLTEILLNYGTETFISMDVRVVDAQSSIQILTPKMRNCIFSDEQETKFGTYRHSDCLALCKVETMQALCGCIPFSQPLNVSNYCSLIDLPCLNKFKMKWTNYYPVGEEDKDSLDFEKYESITCPHCLPACTNEVYDVSVDVTPLKNEPFVWRIYITNVGHKLYKCCGSIYVGRPAHSVLLSPVT
ncbi:sodium channel protein Nach-like isoform X2 [Diabrotica virgifera virgifera]|uniref:Sodium channel protein Nach-like n=1 Tax=Diabrotica virgifera virgifera TaxID=50390 RepID=A0ABM5KVX1_DIAVI|nr:sodium channel protein Nach-like isoform X2 [Diabrotica virgifera virgifera]